MGNQESNLAHFFRSLQNLRRKGEDWSAAHPVKSSLPFLGLTAVILTGSVLANSCTLCYTVDAQGKTVMRFDTWEGNKPANHLYPAMDYRYAGSTGFFFMGYTHSTLNLYEKKL